MRSEHIDRTRFTTLTRPGLPLLARYEPHEDWGTALSLPEIHELTRGLPERRSSGASDLGGALMDAREGDEVIVYLQTSERWPSELQFLSISVLSHMDGEVAGAVLAAIYASYPTLYTTHDFLLRDTTTARLLPRLSDLRELLPLIRLNYLIIHPIESVVPYLGVGFSCSWDEEHGLGLLTYGADILEIGEEDTALSIAAARAHNAERVAVASRGES